MSGPIKPDEVVSAKRAAIPEFVYDVFNALITEHWDGRVAKVLQEDAQTGIAALCRVSDSEVLKRGWLDIEAIYAEAGWVVKYDKPGYNETYEPYFLFKKR